MEENVDRAVDELAAPGVDVIAYCDMVTTFIMEPGWNETKVDQIEKRSHTTAISAWTALRDALTTLGVTQFALGTPYPAAIHALAPPFFTSQGYTVVSDRTLDILKMNDVPNVAPQEIRDFVATLDLKGAEAIVLLATDLPCFSVLAELEREFGLQVLTTHQTILRSAMRAASKSKNTNFVSIPDLGKLFHV